jgi:hypothetical protein
MASVVVSEFLLPLVAKPFPTVPLPQHAQGFRDLAVDDQRLFGHFETALV